MGFSQQAFALQFRDVISSIVKDTLARERPPSRYATVVTFNRGTGTCTVLFAGESDSIDVRMSDGVQPTQPGDVVRIDGKPGNYYISEVVSGLVHRNRENLTMQQNLSGGGVISWDGTNLTWSNRFLAIGTGIGPEALKGYYTIDQPPVDQIIKSHGGMDFPVTTSGVPFTWYGSLYYDPPRGIDAVSHDDRWHMVNFDANFEVPEYWILIGSKTSDDGTPSLKLGTGVQMDHWRIPDLTASTWAAYGTPYDTPAYRMSGDRMVTASGLVTGGTNGVGTPFFILPPGYRPGSRKIFLGLTSLKTDTSGAASTGTAHTHPLPMDNTAARLEVEPGGAVYLNDTLAANTYVSLNGMSWLAEG